MAMTKEEQKAASARILAAHPLTEEELQVYAMLTRQPSDYIPPRENRVCGVCGAEFRAVPMGKETQLTALEQHSDHMAEHNPTPAQWATAHQRIQMSKDRPT